MQIFLDILVLKLEPTLFDDGSVREDRHRGRLYRVKLQS